MQVKVIDKKTGEEKSMSPRFAEILTKMGRATYLTRDMSAQSALQVVETPAASEPEDDQNEPGEQTAAKRATSKKSTK